MFIMNLILIKKVCTTCFVSEGVVCGCVCVCVCVCMCACVCQNNVATRHYINAPAQFIGRHIIKSGGQVAHAESEFLSTL